MKKRLPLESWIGTDGTVERSAFSYDAQRDVYTCPGGKELPRYSHAGRAAKEQPPVDGFYKYHARKATCDACQLRPQCCPHGPQREILRSIHEGARDMARDIGTSDA